MVDISLIASWFCEQNYVFYLQIKREWRKIVRLTAISEKSNIR
nr:MAG TPA: hypothetical protein [Caudoviricetes sp.]